jgi:hypothetical protein
MRSFHGEVFIDEFTHRHQCPNDGVVWEHSLLDEERTHICPVCGLATFLVYSGPDLVTPAAAIAEKIAERAGRAGAARAVTA